MESLMHFSKLPQALGSKINFLRRDLENLQPGMVAVSGGVDSRFLSCLIHALKLDFRAIFFTGPHLSSLEIQETLQSLNFMGLYCHVLELDPLQDTRVTDNSTSRCYWCKKKLFSQALKFGHQINRINIIEGSHLSDAQTHRPGLKALRELDIKSPLQKACLDKLEIRTCMKLLGFPNPDQPSRPCLLTRFSYGLSPDRATLKRLGDAEDELKKLGLQQFRLRILDCDQYLLQVEEKEKKLYQNSRREITQVLTEFRFVPFQIKISNGISGFFDAKP